MTKVIITETQLKSIIKEEINEANLVESLYLLKKNDIVKKIVIALLAGTITISSVPSILNRISEKNPSIEEVGEERLFDKIKNLWEKFSQKEEKESEEKQDENFAEKVEALSEYMAIAAKNQSYSPENILITPEAMITACNETGFDLPLLIAQAHLESCFGLTPRARRTNSVFSVGCYDSGKNAATYATQDDSILPYINLMQKNYLTDDKTVDDILMPGSFVNADNKRYASATDYERKVKSIRNKIISKYPILAS